MVFKVFLLVALVSTSYAWIEEQEVDGMFEGDIEVTPEQMERLQNGTNEFGSIIGKRWSGGVIPYSYESSISSYGRQQIQLAINEYHAKTCLRFVQRTNQRNYISFYNGQGCHSPVGVSGVNRISLQSPGCLSKGTIMHEIGHSIGLLHEQSRPDRDRYVTIHSENLRNPRMIYNFQKASNINSLGTPYDLGSMMHYSSTAFAIRGRKTITTKDRSKQSLIDTYNRITGFSAIDVQQINLMYKGICGGSTGGGTGGGGGGGGSSCQDRNRDCGAWSRRGYCNTSSEYYRYMRANCCLSCRGGSGSSCQDNNRDCAAWARRGYCNRSSIYHPYMKQTCCKSCGF